MRSFRQLASVAALLLQSLSAHADDVITNVMSPIVSFQYPDDFGSQALANGGILSPIVSYQYFEWAGDDVLQLQSSPWVSYYYQFPDAPLLTILPTSRLTTVAETTPAVILPPGASSLLKTFMGGVLTTTPPFPPDTSRMTVVLTHGWNSNPDEWAKSMAADILGNVAPAPNIFVWDWTAASKSTPCLSWQADFVAAARQTPDQGQALGVALQAKLGASYSQRIHFIGHSLGTLVNAHGADYLHQQGYAPANTHATLFDEAEVATDLSCPTLIGAVLFNQWNPFTPRPYYVQPLPKQFAWADNYISAFGVLHPAAHNVILTNGFPASAANLSGLRDQLISFHSYPHQWYAETVRTDVSAMGHRWSFERGGFTGAPSTDTVFLQSFNGSLWNLAPMTFAEGNNYLNDRFQRYRDAVAFAITHRTPDSGQANGTVTGEMMATGPLNAFNLFILSLLTSPGGSQLAPGSFGKSSNSPALAWLPLPIPDDAVSMAFDFKIEGDWQNDSLASALNGTNVLLVAGSGIETNVTLNSGPIDVTAYAGQTNEFFVGIIGGTSTSAHATVMNVAFYTAATPVLRPEANGGDMKLSWSLTAQNFSLESTTNLATTTVWAPVANVPAIVDLQNTVTNPMSGNAGFYRLRK